MYLIAGLGNPGTEYTFTRHNIGFLFIDYLCQELKVRADRLKFQSLYVKTSLEQQDVLLQKPQTYMNLSGQAIVSAMSFYKIPIENVIVVCDDVSLPVGTIRIREKGSDGGHNGLKNIIYLTGSKDFTRIRIGVGAPERSDFDLADYVLSRFLTEEQEIIYENIKNTAKACRLIVKGDISRAMTLYNKNHLEKQP